MTVCTPQLPTPGRRHMALLRTYTSPRYSKMPSTPHTDAVGVHVLLE